MSEVSGLPRAGGGGNAVYALPTLPSTIDPLTARSLSARIVSRQVHEPLVSASSGPYGGERRRIGLATALRPSPDRTVWTLQLRQGVRFQDGSPFNATAVLANSRRWTSVPAGRRALPDLFAVDTPRPGEVRFQLDRPTPDLPRVLADPRLGIVAPQALKPQSGLGASFRRGASGTGTGPFAFGERARARIALARNAGWWGSPLGLGPSLEEVGFTDAGGPVAMEVLLREGRAQIAGPLPSPMLARLAADPRLSSVPRTGGGLGVEGSVRGLYPGQTVPQLSGVWLTTLRG